MYSVHAYFRAIRSNRFKTVYQRCMLLQCFGSSDEASGEVGLGIFVQDVCVCGCVLSVLGSASAHSGPLVVAANPKMHAGWT